MRNLTLKHLRYFEAVAANGNFGLAAKACGISQPALSLQIKDLEVSLGIILFERRAREVRLTRFGEEFAPRVRETLRSVDELGDLARSSKDQLHVKLRVGVIPTIAPYLLPRIIEKTSAIQPELDIQFRESLTNKLLDELNEGLIDTAIVALPVSEAAFAEVELFQENFVLVRPLEDAGKPVPNHKMLQKMKLLLLEEGHCFRDQALSFCKMDIIRPWGGLDGSTLTTLVQLVGAGKGITLLPEMAVPVETRSADVSIAQFPEPQPRRTVGMIWRKTNPLAEQLRELSEIVRLSAEGWQVEDQRNGKN